MASKRLYHIILKQGIRIPKETPIWESLIGSFARLRRKAPRGIADCFHFISYNQDIAVSGHFAIAGDLNLS
jgi:hypothetical protein